MINYLNIIFKIRDIQLDIVHYLQMDADKKYFAGFIKESLKSYKFLENKINVKRPENFFKAGLIFLN